jgi:hypothetical protein
MRVNMIPTFLIPLDLKTPPLKADLKRKKHNNRKRIEEIIMIVIKILTILDAGRGKWIFNRK